MTQLAEQKLTALLAWPEIDGRTGQAKLLRHYAHAYAEDLGGVANLSNMQIQACKRLAELSVFSDANVTDYINNGGTFDLETQIKLSNTFDRLYGRLQRDADKYRAKRNDALDPYGDAYNG